MASNRSTPTERPVTLNDVAKLAGVSISTASKAMNNRQQVRAQTREKVLAAAEQLGFVPNSLARGLLEGRTGTVGLLTNDLEGRFSIPILMGAEDAFGAGQVSVFLCDARGDAIREQHHLRALLSRRVDGLIVVGDRPDPRPSLGQGVGVPVVYVYAPSRDPRDLSVVADSSGGGQLAAEHLLALGRTKIAHITGDPTYGATGDRVTGMLRVLDQAGVALVGGKALFGDWTESWGRGAARMLLGRYPEVDGIFCGSDQIARGVLDALRELGREVPADVAVVGHDNWDVLATNSRPQLTSIDMNLELLGRQAAQFLVAAIGGQRASGVHKFAGRLVPRGSTTLLN